MKPGLFVYPLLVSLWGFYLPVNAQTSCSAVNAIEGTYQCTGECVVTDASGNRSLVAVSEETDIIKRYTGSKAGLYEVHITGADNFKELEIGALTGLEMRTATAQVSDGIYPVLEEYIFTTDESCQAKGFTKIVRNPGRENFKACSILCEKEN